MFRSEQSKLGATSRTSGLCSRAFGYAGTHDQWIANPTAKPEVAAP